MRAARVTPGATYLSSSSHFAAMLYSKIVNPGALRPGRDQAIDQVAADRIDDLYMAEFSNVHGWSAYPPILSVNADILVRQLSAISRHMQSSKTALLFDHLVSAREKHWWHFEAKRLRGLEVDHKLVPCRRLHR